MRVVVLDTNCLVQIISKRCPYHNVWTAYQKGEFKISVTTEILNEYFEILTLVTNEIVAGGIIDFITTSPDTIFCTTYFKFNLIKSDIDDNKFVDCAIVSNAEFIVSNDHHCDILKQIDYPKVDIKTLKEFSKEL